MRRMGLHDILVKWMSMCMNSVNYQVIVNGERVRPIIPKRGLRQGDPLSPYLFIICVEGLSAQLKKAEARVDIHGVKLCRGALILTHLLFADDCFIFCKANMQESIKLKEILQSYEAMSEQAINFRKPEIFSKNTSEADRSQSKMSYRYKKVLEP